MKIIVGILVALGVVVAGLAGWAWYKKSEDNREYNIPIAMALDDGYTYPTIVAITSIMENAKSGTNYDFYIMHPGEFSDENKDKLTSLQGKYDKCKINLIDMADKYRNANDKGAITTPTYYRLSLSELIPDRDKIIWLDGDTITYTDLREMYKIDMSGYYYKGFLDFPGQDEFAADNDHYICAGVMLINLKELRENDMVNKFAKFIEENNDKLSKHDQTTINALCKDKNGILPAKYGIFCFDNAEHAANYSDILNSEKKYTKRELVNAFNNPGVLHCTTKPWKTLKVYGADKWWEYAKKTDYYNEIKEKYGSIFNG